MCRVPSLRGYRACRPSTTLSVVIATCGSGSATKSTVCGSTHGKEKLLMVARRNGPPIDLSQGSKVRVNPSTIVVQSAQAFRDIHGLKSNVQGSKKYEFWQSKESEVNKRRCPPPQKKTDFDPRLQRKFNTGH